jgi:mannitol-1-phosphate/altronate dehydrogenase
MTSTTRDVPPQHSEITALCLGTGRFLRSVLVPALVHAHHSVALIQPRGTSLQEYLAQRRLSDKRTDSTDTYEVDTVLPDGSIVTDEVPIAACFSMGQEQKRHEFFQALPHMTKGYVRSLYYLYMHLSIQVVSFDGFTHPLLLPLHLRWAVPRSISVLGVGVTEAGLAHQDTQAMKDLFAILSALQQQQSSSSSSSSPKLVVIDMDNVPNNGTKLQEYMLAHAAAAAADNNGNNDSDSMTTFLTTRVLFCNTMVDRITSSRPGSHGMVPQCEPLPLKALVIGDYHDDYIRTNHLLVPPPPPAPLARPASSSPTTPLPSPTGIVLRSTPAELQKDLDLKLFIANGTHTAIAHTLALLGHTMTNVLSDPHHSLFMDYLETLVQDQIIPACTTTTRLPAPTSVEEAQAVWQDWKQRLIHPHFGLSSFFITQNGTAKGGIRWGPTMSTLLMEATSPHVSFAVAYAVLLRWLTTTHMTHHGTADGVYRGWLNGFDPSSTLVSTTTTTTTSSGEDSSSRSPTCVEYADGLCYDLQQGWYDFKCPLPDLVDKLHTCLKNKAQPQACREAVRYYLTNDQGGNLTSPTTTTTTTSNFEELVDAVSVLYARLIAGDDLLGILHELQTSASGISLSSPCSALLLTTVVSPSTASSAVAAGTRPLHYRLHSIPDSSRLLDHQVTLSSIEDVVTSEVQSVLAVDLHTHLLPPSHGPLCLWGIDELLTYVSLSRVGGEDGALTRSLVNSTFSFLRACVFCV